MSSLAESIDPEEESFSPGALSQTATASMKPTRRVCKAYVLFEYL